nr:hypothetical protein OH837_49015 [Streptomyces canus]
MNPRPSTDELFNGDLVALHDPDLDVFVMKGHHDVEAIGRLLAAEDGVPPLFRDVGVIPGTARTAWALFSWHREACDAVGEPRPWCLCGLDEGGSRVDWFPREVPEGTSGAVAVTWFAAVRPAPVPAH